MQTRIRLANLVYFLSNAQVGKATAETGQITWPTTRAADGGAYGPPGGDKTITLPLLTREFYSPIEFPLFSCKPPGNMPVAVRQFILRHYSGYNSRLFVFMAIHLLFV